MAKPTPEFVAGIAFAAASLLARADRIQSQHGSGYCGRALETKGEASRLLQEAADILNRPEEPTDAPQT